MCGIAGWYARGGRPVDVGTLRAMCATIVHRGPDDEGVLAEGDFGFGMRRLAIVDLAGGHQPMESDDARYSVTFNGEIFNYPQLRRELEALGHTFRTHSDTESILRGFQSWGAGVWPKLEGMFAVALWDRHERTLHMARDPLGIKPLYYTLQHGGVAWGSELKTLTAGAGAVIHAAARSRWTSTSRSGTCWRRTRSTTRWSSSSPVACSRRGRPAIRASSASGSCGSARRRRPPRPSGSSASARSSRRS